MANQELILLRLEALFPPPPILSPYTKPTQDVHHRIRKGVNTVLPRFHVGGGFDSFLAFVPMA